MREQEIEEKGALRIRKHVRYGEKKKKNQIDRTRKDQSLEMKSAKME